jgi:hypothetical protein
MTFKLFELDKILIKYSRGKQFKTNYFFSACDKKNQTKKSFQGPFGWTVEWEGLRCQKS